MNTYLFLMQGFPALCTSARWTLHAVSGSWSTNAPCLADMSVQGSCRRVCITSWWGWYLRGACRQQGVGAPRQLGLVAHVRLHGLALLLPVHPLAILQQTTLTLLAKHLPSVPLAVGTAVHCRQRWELALAGLSTSLRLRLVQVLVRAHYGVLLRGRLRLGLLRFELLRLGELLLL